MLLLEDLKLFFDIFEFFLNLVDLILQLLFVLISLIDLLLFLFEIVFEVLAFLIKLLVEKLYLFQITLEEGLDTLLLIPVRVNFILNFVDHGLFALSTIN